jgi:hypothetical protein
MRAFQNAPVRKQAATASAILGTGGVDKLRRALELPLPGQNAKHWDSFSEAFAPHVDRIVREAGEDGLAVTLAWLRRFDRDAGGRY